MSDDTLILKREELYEAVWSEPVQKLAAKYFISGTALAKICRKLSIPVPRRGHWAKAKFGRAGRRPALRPLRQGERSAHVIYGYRRRMAELLGPDVQQAIALERSPDARISVAEELAAPHPLVKKFKGLLWRTALKAKEAGNEQACLDVTVSRAQLDRALRIMDALLKALEARGHEVYVSEPKTVAYRYGGGSHLCPSETGVRIGDTEVEFGIEEVMDTIRTAEPRLKDGEERWQWYMRNPRPWHIHKPSGRLALVLRAGYYASPRKTWRDGKRQRVENSLNEFIAAIVETAERVRLHRLEQEREEREAAERRRRLEEEERQRQLEAARRRDLIRRVRDLEFAARVRRLVDAVEQRVASDSGFAVMRRA